jgi:hypothetical protein
LSKIESELRQLGVAADDGRILDPFGRIPGPVDRGGVLKRIQKPGESRSILDVFVHFSFQERHSIRWRS